MTVLGALLGLALLTAAAATLRDIRGGAALLVGGVYTGAALSPAFLAWRALHPAGRLSSFLDGHGLSAALLVLSALILGGSWWAASHVTSRFPLSGRWRWARAASHVPLTIAGLGIISGHTGLIMPALAGWALRPVTALYLRWGAGERRSVEDTSLPRHHVRAVGALIVCLALLAGAGMLWPERPLEPLNLSRLLTLSHGTPGP